VRTCAEESAAHGWQVIADTGYPGYLEIPQLVVEGYSTLFVEYAEQQVVQPDIVFVQGGVGGLLCAAVRHFGSTVKSWRWSRWMPTACCNRFLRRMVRRGLQAEGRIRSCRGSIAVRCL